MNLDRALSPHFYLREMVHSETAERIAALRDQQRRPPDAVVLELLGLATRCLEPLRVDIGVPLRVQSGYRSRDLNRRIGGAKRSQHLVGQAADLVPLFPDALAVAAFRERVRAGIAEFSESAAGTDGGGELGLRPNVSSVGLLFAWVVLHLDAFEIDQVIHEYGDGPGRPAWLHISSCPTEGRRQILRYHHGQDGKVQVAQLGVKGALRLCG